MADKRKMKKKKDADEGSFYPKDKPPKLMKDVAKWMKKNVPTKKTKFLYHQVNYFIGSKAVDALMSSNWAKPKKENEAPVFADRVAVTQFLDLMLRYKFFHRAKKIAVSDAFLKKGKKKEDKSEEGEKTVKEKKEEKKKAKTEGDEEETKAEDAESSQGEGKEKESEKKEDKKQLEVKAKEKRKIRLDMHLEQQFLDSSDAYVWIYDPIPLWYWGAGTLVVIATVGLCLFPLWPPTLRKGVYYLSIAAAGFLIAILALAVLRFLMFCLVWVASLGKHHFWLLPNLTEDVGFFASFWPLYQYEYKGKGGKSKPKKKKKKAKDSDAEDDNEDVPQAASDEKMEERAEGHESGIQEVEDDKGDGEKSETESEGSSQKSQTGKDFEILEKEDTNE